MTTIYKEDIKDAQNRMKAWWDHEILDRPVIQYHHPNPHVRKYFSVEHWFLAQHWDMYEEYTNRFEASAATTFHGGDQIPNLFLNYGPGIMAAVFGVVPKYLSETVWFERKTELSDIVNVLETAPMNMNNPWYARLIHATEYCAKRANDTGNAYSVSFTDLGGVLDILASFLPPKEIIMAMMRNPGIIDTCRAIILEKLNIMYQELAKIYARYNLGYNSWLNAWCPDTWYPLQCDFSAMLSPKLFRRFVLPDLRAQASKMKYSIYHLDGPNELPYIDDLLACPEITGIQWVPGSQGPPNEHEKWLPLYKKIQNAHKNICISCAGEAVSKMYHDLDPKGLLISTGYNSQIMAEFYLPKFMGGLEGIEPEE